MSAAAPAARYPLGYVAPAIGSRVMIPSGLTSNAWMEVTVLEVVPHVGSRLPEVIGAPYGSQRATFRSEEWRALGAVEQRCGTCYRVVPEGETFAEHAASSEFHASIARVLEAKL